MMWGSPFCTLDNYVYDVHWGSVDLLYFHTCTVARPSEAERHALYLLCAPGDCRMRHVSVGLKCVTTLTGGLT